MKTEPLNWQLAPAGFHAGNTLLHLAQTYPTIEKVVQEILQNAIDAGATQAHVSLDLTECRLRAYDNGSGASKEQMRERVLNIGKPMKGGDKIGEKGIGNLAPVSLCTRYRMITRPRDAKPRPPFFEFRFDPQDLETQATVNFAYADRPDFSFSGRFAESSTFIDVSGIKPAALQRLRKSPSKAAEALASAVTDAFPAKIKSTGIRITIEVKAAGQDWEVEAKPVEFPGIRNEIHIPTDLGEVVFELYLTLNQVQKPRILIDHQGKQAFPLQNLEASWGDIEEFFGSGFIQGRIRLEFCTLAPDRTRLQMDDAYVHFHNALIKFVETYGTPWLRQVNEDRRAERLSKIAQEVVERLEKGLFGDGEIPESLRCPAGIPGKGPEGKAPRPPVRRVVPPLVPGGPPRQKGQTRRKGKDRPDLAYRRVQPSARSARGMTALFREGDDAHGYKWHARLGTEGPEKGGIIINMSHPDLTAAEQRGPLYHKLYVTSCVMAIAVSVQMEPGVAEQFMRGWEEYVAPQTFNLMVRPF
ncbi:MAG: ATP-binding protein [Candidatus Aenigmarchaeota archaeon]|nr:ATP-binding protein [Candidatus Aenigmarchaeota archaeon]